MKRIIPFILLWLLLFSGSSDLYVKYYLGFSFNPGPNMELVTFARITVRDGIIVKQDYISKDNFINIASGNESNKANPNETDLFTAFGIDPCFYQPFKAEENSISKKKSKNRCTGIDDLWRLRYKTHPQYRVNHFNEDQTVFGGWTSEDKYPSNGQINILRQYGISNLIDFFYGEKAFILFKDMQDPNWVAKYKAS